MTTIKFEEAKADFENLGRKAEAGESTVVLKDHRPAFMIGPLSEPYFPRPKKLGVAEGEMWMSPDFDKTPEDVIRDWEGDE